MLKEEEEEKVEKPAKGQRITNGVKGNGKGEDGRGVEEKKNKEEVEVRVQKERKSGKR